MATIVCQGLQSCLQEPHLVEPRTLRLKLSSPIPHHLFSATPLELGFKSFLSSESNHIKELTHHEEKCHHDKPVTKDNNSDLGSCWSFLQANTTSQQQNPSTQVYNKRSSNVTRLNEKSLELCTENLGNETGTIFIENSIFESKDENRDEQKQKSSKSLGGKKAATVHNFPPPLTTISGKESIHVRPHREEGRLVLKAVKSPLTQTCFQAERSNGRLRLCFSQDFFASDFDFEPQITAAKQEDIEANSEKDNENEGYENDGDVEEQEVGDIDKEVLGEEEEGRVCLIEELEENGMKVGGEEGMDKFERPLSRCKEGGEQEKKGLLNFEPFNWVAT